MYDEMTLDVIEHESGLLRARIVVDEDCEIPEWNEVELTALDSSHYTWDANDPAVMEAFERFRYFARVGKYANRRDHDRAERMLERYMRLFHDSTVVVRWSGGQAPGDGVTIAYVATSEVPRADIETFASEVERWRAGETFGIIIERRDSEDVHDSDAWVEVEACWGYVGEDYARSVATEDLDSVAQTHTLQLALEV